MTERRRQLLEALRDRPLRYEHLRELGFHGNAIQPAQRDGHVAHLPVYGWGLTTLGRLALSAVTGSEA